MANTVIAVAYFPGIVSQKYWLLYYEIFAVTCSIQEIVGRLVTAFSVATSP